MDTKQTRITVARKKRIVNALKKGTFSPAVIAKKSGLPIETIADLAKEYLKIPDSDISLEEVFELIKGELREIPQKSAETITSEILPEVQKDDPAPVPPDTSPAKDYFSLAEKGRIVAMLKSGEQTPKQVAEQAGISVETLADWTRICMGIPDEGQAPVDIFWMFRNRKMPVKSRKKAAVKQTPAASCFPKRTEAQLCWGCINAVPSEKHGCPWSESFTPVDGWQAEKTSNSYHIINCPLFERG